jgi:hypothetical protein
MLPLKVLLRTPSLLVALTVKLNAPVPVGVPDSVSVFVLVPDTDVMMPAGKLPAEIAHVVAVDVLMTKASE